MACNPGGPRRIHQTRAGIERFAAVGSFHDAQVGGVILQANGQRHHILGGGGDGSGILNALPRLKDWHQPDRTVDLVAHLEFVDHVIDLRNLAGMLDFRNQD